jgi:hypothetical protein
VGGRADLQGAAVRPIHLLRGPAPSAVSAGGSLSLSSCGSFRSTSQPSKAARSPIPRTLGQRRQGTARATSPRPRHLRAATLK